MSEPNQKPGFRQVMGSVLASFIGVQSRKNRERDFKHGNVFHYIIAGAALTLVFILVVYGVVKLVLSSAGI